MNNALEKLVPNIRDQFPVFVRYPALSYLDSAATSQKPQVVLDALLEFYQRSNANIHRGVYSLSQQASFQYEESREAVASFLGAHSPSEIIFLRGTTEAMNLLAHSFLAPRLAEGDTILLTEMEHHSNIVPWQIVATRAKAQIEYVPVTERGELCLETARKQLARRPKLFSVTHVSNVLGTINPIRELADLAHEHGVPLVVDGAQAVGHIPVDLAALGCDFYAFSGHKAYGPMGIGALWGKAEHLSAMSPYHGGGGMIDEVLEQHSSFAPAPARFEAGTPSVADACALKAALQFVSSCGLERLAQHSRTLGDLARRELRSLSSVRVFGDAPGASGIVSFAVDGVHPHDLATVLDSQDVAVRAGHHCTQILHRKLHVNATVRASFAIYNSEADVARLIAGVSYAKQLFTPKPKVVPAQFNPLSAAPRAATATNFGKGTTDV